MGHEAVFKVLSDIATADAITYWIVGGLTALVYLIMRAMLPVKGLATVFAPGMFWGGLVGIYIFRELAIVVSNEKSANVVAASVAGMVLALFVMVALVRLFEAVGRIRRPVTNKLAPPSTRAKTSP